VASDQFIDRVPIGQGIHVRFSGSEQESVSPPVLLGFRGLELTGWLGSTALEVSRRQYSPAFRTALALLAAAV
jgi:hypothetical protein